MTYHCEECGAVLDPAKVLRCIKCKACFYCSRACQTRNWRRIHKRVCTTDPLLRPFIRVEMAVERALTKEPKVQAPKEATCYICLDGEEGGKLMRGCACRGDSAGFVHLDCLVELAESKEASRDLQAICKVWIFCGNCKQSFQGALELEMTRRFWRHYRSGQHLGLRYDSSKSLAACLATNGEFDAVNQLLDEASTCVGNDTVAFLDLKGCRVNLLRMNGQRLEALGLLQAMLPEAKECSDADPQIYGQTLHQVAHLLLGLGRNQEAHEAATELVAFNKAKFGPESSLALSAVEMYATACAKLGRMEEAKANFNVAFVTQARVLGREHEATQKTWQQMRIYGFA